MPTSKERQPTLGELIAKIKQNLPALESAVISIVPLSGIQQRAIKQFAQSLRKAEVAVARATQDAPRTKTGGQAPPGPKGGQASLAGWDDDRSALIKFLQDTRTLVKYLVEHRVPRKGETREKFVNCFPDVDRSVEDAIKQLNEIDSDQHDLYKRLTQSGLTMGNLKLKLRELRDSFDSSSILSALRIARRILGSLVKDIPFIELLKEFLETVEERLQRSPDEELTQLHIYDFEMR